jgi:hypothetical protein
MQLVGLMMRGISAGLAVAAGAVLIVSVNRLDYARIHGLAAPAGEMSSRVHFKGGPDVYVSEGLAWFIRYGVSLQICLFCLAFALFMFSLYVDRRRISATRT